MDELGCAQPLVKLVADAYRSFAAAPPPWTPGEERRYSAARRPKLEVAHGLRAMRASRGPGGGLGGLAARVVRVARRFSGCARPQWSRTAQRLRRPRQRVGRGCALGVRRAEGPPRRRRRNRQAPHRCQCGEACRAPPKCSSRSATFSCRPTEMPGPRAVAALLTGRFDRPLRAAPAWKCERAATAVGWRPLYE